MTDERTEREPGPEGPDDTTGNTGPGAGPGPVAAERRDHEGTTMQTMAQTAKLVARGRRLSWTCPCCGRTLGEVYDDRVTVKAGERMLIFPVDAPVIQLCPRCGTESTVSKTTDAA